MRIALFTDVFLPQINGVVTSTLSLAKGLADRNHKVYIIAPKFKGNREFQYKNVIVKRVYSIPALFYPGFKFASPFSPEILNFIKKEKIELIHFQTPMSLGIQAILISRLLKIPLVGTFHTNISNPQYLRHMRINSKLIAPISKKYIKWYYGNCNLVTCPSESIRKELKKENINSHIKVFSNGIDLSLFKPLKTKKKQKNLIFVGRIAHEKNLFYLLECFKIVLKKLPETKLIIIGDGPQMNELKNKINEDNLSKNIILTGEIEHTKLIKSNFYKESYTFVTASLSETQGITLMEAQANGLPSVGIDAAGSRDLIKNNYNGFLVKENKKSFADAIIKILSDERLFIRMKKNTLKEIKNHELSAVISEWEKTYLELIKNES